MSRASNNGKLPEEYRAVVREELALGGIPYVRQRINALKDVPSTLLPRALAYANELTGELFDPDELAEVAEYGADAHRLAVDKVVKRKRAERDANVQLASDGVEPPTFPPGTLADDLALPDLEQEYLVDELLPIGGNVVLAGFRKSGKTTLMQNLVKALADDEPFLDMFATKLTGRICIVNYELSDAMQRRWLREAEIQNPDRIAAPLNYRGRSLPFWTPTVRDAFANHLAETEIQVLILDPGARASRGLVIDENSNSQMVAFTAAVDELKRLSGVQEVVIPVHTGRAIVTDGNEHSRGATSLEDWADALWFLTKDDKDRRFLRALGRDVELEATELHYEPSDRSLHYTGRKRSERRREDEVLTVLLALADFEAAENYPTPTAALQSGMNLAQNRRSPAVKAAVDGGYVVRADGRKGAKLCSFTDKGRRRLESGDDQ